MISKQDPGREAGPEVGAGPNPADLVKDNFAAPVAALLPGYPIFDSDAADNFTFDFLSPGTLVGVTAAPTNPLDADLVIYDLLDDAGGRFGIDSLTGMVFQTNGPALDFTAADSYTICVRGQSPGRTPETAEFEIGVGTHFAGVVVLSADLAVGGEVVDQYRNRIVGNGLFTDTNDLGDYLLPYNQTAGATFDFGGPDATPRPRIAQSSTVVGTSFLAPTRDYLIHNFATATRTGIQTGISLTGIPLQSSDFPTSGLSSYNLDTGQTLGNRIPFVRDFADGNSPTGVVGKMYISLEISNIVFDPNPAFAQASLIFNGNDATGLVVATGKIRTDSNGQPFLTGQVMGSLYRSGGGGGGGGNAHLIGGGIATADIGDGLDFLGNGTPRAFLLEAATVDTNDVTQSTGLIETGGSITSPLQSTYFPNVAALGGPDNDINTSRQTSFLEGYMAGAMISTISSSASSVTSLCDNSSPNQAFIARDRERSNMFAILQKEGNNLAAGFIIHDRATGNDTRIVVSADSDTFGFINDDLFAFSKANGFDSLTTTPAGSVKMPSRSVIALASSGMVPLPASQIPTGVTLCQCDYMRWGFWTTDITFANGDAIKVPLAHWVAGERDFTTPSAGTASYAGHAMGNIERAGIRPFIAEMTATYDFSSRTGKIAINNIENRNFEFEIAGVAGDAGQKRFAGRLTTGTFGYAGFTKGSFFGTPSNPAVGLGGDFFLARDTTVKERIVGVFVGER